MRTMPNDAAQVRALAQLLSYFGWTWVGLIGRESDYARFAIELFLQVSVQYGVCAAYTHMYTLDQNEQALDELLDVIQVRYMSTIHFQMENPKQTVYLLPPLYICFLNYSKV